MMNKTAIILAGGQSRRMGQNKAFLAYKEKSFIEEILDKFQGLDERIIVANTPSLYVFEGVKTIQDIYPNKGPLCGLYTGLKEMSGKRAVVVTVDTPLLTEALLSFLYNYESDADCIIPVVEGRWQSLCAVYNKSALNRIEEAVKADERKVRLVLDRLSVELITEETLTRYGNPKVLFSNVNTPEDYGKIRGL